MRTSPQDILARLTDEVSGDALNAYLTTLAGDPNWRVTAGDGVTMRTLSLLYFPTGETLDVVLMRVGRVWKVRVQPGAPSSHAA